MESKIHLYEQFSSRKGFNTSLLHFQAVMDIIADMQDGYNLADILNELLKRRGIEQAQIPSVTAALLFDKYSYSIKSGNFTSTATDFTAIAEEFAKWKAVDMVITYFHPELGLMLINPCNPSSWKNISEFRKNEYFAVYAGYLTDDVKDRSAADAAVATAFDMLTGGRKKVNEILLKGKYTFKPYAEEPSASKPKARSKTKSKPVKSGKKAEVIEAEAEEKETLLSQEPAGDKRMTPLYSVPVTNELFHNGNVEAWKRIIQSYKTKHPDLDVFIYYEGERIHNIASLFKWGKVKHGSSILFAVAGDDITDVAKLQKYLKQGASPQFEAFLRFPVNTVLNLF